MNSPDPATEAQEAPEPDQLQDVGPSPADPPEQSEVERLRQEAQVLQDQLLRRAAEFQNYRRRSEGDRAEANRQGRAAVLVPVLEVFDDLQRSLDAARLTLPDEGAEASPAASLVAGLELVLQKFVDTLGRLDVQSIPAVGLPFDEQVHEAILQQPAPGDEVSGTVLAEVQPGYSMGDRVIRHARVIVAQ